MNPVLRWFHQLGSPPYFDRFAARWAPWGYGLGLPIARGIVTEHGGKIWADSQAGRVTLRVQIPLN